jgi:hypothetical protein
VISDNEGEVIFVDIAWQLGKAPGGKGDGQGGFSGHGWRPFDFLSPTE